MKNKFIITLIFMFALSASIISLENVFACSSCGCSVASHGSGAGTEEEELMHEHEVEGLTVEQQAELESAIKNIDPVDMEGVAEDYSDE